MEGFTHLNPEGRARMVDVTHKPPTARRAVARGSVRMKPETLEAIRAGQIAKGDVLAVAQVAGVMGAKQTGNWIPMCHPLPISGCDLRFRLNEALSQVEIEASVSVNGPTGVEMEALTAVQAAALTIYDMAKARDKAMTIGPAYLLTKEGGKSGFYHQFRAQIEGVSSDGPVPSVFLTKGAQVLLIPHTEAPLLEGKALHLNQADLLTLKPGTTLETGTAHLEIVDVHDQRRVAAIKEAGVVHRADWIIQVH